MSKLNDDPRIDPRIKAIFGMTPDFGPAGDVKNRAEMLAYEASEEGLATAAGMKAMFDRAVPVCAGRQLGQYPIHPPRHRRDPPLRLLHPWRRHDGHVLL